ncbi:MAG: regulatory protein RecX [Legionellaceae bacterium]|nr:regulatory protein RecX [Legionellaceae bacterium]
MTPNAFSLALACLSRREHSAAELTQKLRRKGCGETEVAEAIAECQRLGYQSDERYVDAYCRIRVAQGDGPLKIRQFLSAKGIENETIAARLAQEDWQEHAQRLWMKKFAVPSAELSLREKAKQQRFFCNRGFPASVLAHLGDE